MARPKKGSVSQKAAGILNAFSESPEQLIPTNVELLQATVDALIERVTLIDKEEASQLDVYVQLLGALSAYWAKVPSNPIAGISDGVRATLEVRDYRVILDEIASGKKTKKTHCHETVVMQGRLLDRYLENHVDFKKCRNTITRKDWITKHASAINELLVPVPCFCEYDDKLVTDNWHLNPNTIEELKDVFVEPRWLRTFLDKESVLTAPKLRDALLAMLHGTTPGQIAQIRKQTETFYSLSSFF